VVKNKTKHKGETEMKTRNKLLGVIALMAIIGIAIIGCQQDNPPPQEQPIDYITDNAGNQIPIYKTDGVSDADAVTAANNIKTAFNREEINQYRDTLYGGIKKIYLLTGDSQDLYSFDKQTGILKVGTGWDFSTYMNCFIYAVYPALQDQQKQPDTPRTLSFGTTENPCSVTIKSDDQFTTAEWKTLCDKVVAAIMRGYNSDYMDFLNKPIFENMFGNNGISVVLLKSATYDCEVKDGNYTTIYLKTSTINMIDLQPAVWVLADDTGSYHHP
jgi:hypothetical protein